MGSCPLVPNLNGTGAAPATTNEPSEDPLVALRQNGVAMGAGTLLVEAGAAKLSGTLERARSAKNIILKVNNESLF